MHRTCVIRCGLLPSPFWLLFTLLPHQVGTLDSLVAMSDQFAKMDPYIEGMVQKIVKYIHDILDPEDRVRECVCDRCSFVHCV